MKIDAIISAPLSEVAAAARRAEELGCDGIMIPEVAHDPFLPVMEAARVTSTARLVTGIAVAFARNPMNVAVLASDLHRYSNGRFALGLGSQIKPHITRRFSMPWSQPTERMTEFIGAVRAIWDAWETGTPLRFVGEFYRHTLMTPMFDHGPSPCGWPTIHLAAVGPAMTAVAGTVADGINTHGFTTPDYVREVTVPRLAESLAAAGRDRSAFEVSLPAMAAIVESDDDPKLVASRGTIAFYGSTPAYRGVLEHHGWGALGDELHRLSVEGKWKEMGALIDDEVLHTFVAVGDAATVGREIVRRYGDSIDRLQLGLSTDDDEMVTLLDALRTASAS